jgi:hypothetical protein
MTNYAAILQHHIITSTRYIQNEKERKKRTGARSEPAKGSAIKDG